MSDSRYRAFTTTVELGSLTAAAEKLGYTQSGVSHLIDALEDEMGFRLLRRSRKGAELTLEGERILPLVQAALRATDLVGETAGEIKGLRSGNLRIGTFSSVALQWLPGLLGEFMEKYPGIHVDVFNGTYSTIEQKLREHSLDCAFVTLPQGEGIEALMLAEDPLMAILPTGHRLERKKSVEPSDLEDEAFIIPAEGANYDIGTVFGLMGKQPVIRFDMSDDYAAIEMVRAGHGITVLPQLLIRDLPMDRLRAVPIRGTVRRIGIAYPSLGDSPAVRAFVELCSKLK